MRVGSKKRRSKIEMVHRIGTILYAYPTFLIPPLLKSTSESKKFPKYYRVTRENLYTSILYNILSFISTSTAGNFMIIQNMSAKFGTDNSPRAQSIMNFS